MCVCVCVFICEVYCWVPRCRAEREEEERRRRLAGQPNAVAVQLFGIQDQFEMR